MRIKMLRTVHPFMDAPASDFAVLCAAMPSLANRVLEAGEVYEAGTTPRGAVYARLPDGSVMGVKPDECEFVEGS